MNCRHCHREITLDPTDGWIDPEATGDDAIWRETCDSNDTFTAEHELMPEESPIRCFRNGPRGYRCIKDHGHAGSHA